MRAGEYVAFIAALMAVNALGVDLMLPALADMGRQLGIATANHRQWIITVYMLGFGAGQLVYGPLADRYGRRPILLVTLAGFVGASIFAAGSQTFAALLGARVLQGLMSASTRVLAVAIVRDRFSGRQMARTLSIAQMIFFLVPIMAPSLGQVLLGFGPWRFIFYALAGFAAFVLAWSALRLTESLPVARRSPLSLASLKNAYRLTLINRFSAGYAVCASMTFGGVIAFVSSAQQIFVDEFGAGDRFTILFALCAFSMGCASFANSRLVERLGTRLISQSAVLGLIALSVLHLGVIAAGHETLITYMLFQALSMTCIGLCGSNFGAMAMEPVGHIAGTASSIQGFITSVGAVIVGSAIGQAYNGTTYPLAIGYLAIGLGVLTLVYLIEDRQLFRARHAG
ncbi:multidrug effflux MFS transporter [Sphingomonas sanguinis]|uniref:Multidrug effflux MFS transporter n=1 Tax=Sphingomonas sanguinis TaxID=33051 RepID=A0A7Y7UQX3_9SPHN|nr:multidrug effflux MFS transporter [Sphingomonas sanguinis]MBZ6382414.1 multidrug effflux MFS transporter [Sphingomonas sanguinis]NNG50605.1 multidrug effflux MFS transporter [Sphingomonas sanguinis]NNG54683.1 multidrug effflux MFS transporter [Sphingomonas sanguinis]NVP31712.1 multidrug effflux MFS transporter [Sphingomonas sanguinis]